jgi:hypothetical protein
MKYSKFTNAIFATILMFCTVGLTYAQSKDVTSDGFSPEAAAWLKKNPEVRKCADAMNVASQKDQKRQGLDQTTSSDMYGEFIETCSKKRSKTSIAPSNIQTPSGRCAPGWMNIDGVCRDYNTPPVHTTQAATPNGPAEVRNRKNNKAWQDDNGFMHYPNGKVSSGSVD